MTANIWMIPDNLVPRATRWAYVAHTGQEYSGGTYFEKHLIPTVRVIRAARDTAAATSDLLLPEYKWMPLVLAAGFLHDTLEDTDTDMGDLENNFGSEVTDIVGALTATEGNRTARAATTVEQIKALPMHLQPLARIVKVADRIVNVEASWKDKDPRLFMYQREYKAFHKALRPDVCTVTEGALWRRLNVLMVGADR